MAAIIQKDIKVVHDFNTQRTQAFNLSSDPLERSPFIPLPQDLRDHMVKIDSARAQRHTPTGKASVSDQTKKELQAMGYII